MIVGKTLIVYKSTGRLCGPYFIDHLLTSDDVLCGNGVHGNDDHDDVPIDSSVVFDSNVFDDGDGGSYDGDGDGSGGYVPSVYYQCAGCKRGVRDSN